MSARCKKCGGPVGEPARCTNGHDQPPAEPLDRLAELLGENIDYDRLADLVAARLRRFVSDLVAQMPEPDQLVDANTIARLTGMSQRWVYDHADQLGAIRAGDGTRPRLRFNPALVRARLDQRNGDLPTPQTPVPAPPPMPLAELLPVKGRAYDGSMDLEPWTKGAGGHTMIATGKAGPGGAVTPSEALDTEVQAPCPRRE